MRSANCDPPNEHTRWRTTINNLEFDSLGGLCACLSLSMVCSIIYLANYPNSTSLKCLFLSVSLRICWLFRIIYWVASVDASRIGLAEGTRLCSPIRLFAKFGRTASGVGGKRKRWSAWVDRHLKARLFWKSICSVIGSERETKSWIAFKIVKPKKFFKNHESDKTDRPLSTVTERAQLVLHYLADWRRLAAKLTFDLFWF